MRKVHFNALALFGVYGFTFLYIAWRHLKTIRDGGDLYLQGDWLISFADGPVRRGLSGELFLGLGEAIGVSPILLLGAVQLALKAGIFVTLLHIALARGLSDRMVLVLLSPALVVFWVNDPFTPFRKELLGYLAFAPLFLGRAGPVPAGRLAATAALFALAIAFHEANAVFAVPLVLVFAILLERGRALAWSAAVGAIALAGTAFSLLHLSVPDTTAMCARVLAAGAHPGICEGSMSWLSREFDEVVAGGWELVGIFGGARNFALAAVLAVVLFGVVFALMRPAVADRRAAAALALGLLAFLPLYLMGGDWGRWVSAQMFVALFLLLALAERVPAAALARPVPPAAYAAVLGFNLLVGVYHMVPRPIPGFAVTFVTAVRNFLT